MTDVLDIASDVASRAATGECLEVYVSTGTETEVRAYQGDVESLTSASSSGIGVRVLLEGADGARVGFAAAGSLAPDVIDEVLRDARDNARFATPDEMVAFATPDGVTVTELVLEDPTLSSMPTDDKIALALELERAARAADSRVRQIDEASYGDATAESALVSTTGISATARRSVSWLSVAAIANGSGRDQTGYASKAARGASGLDVEATALDAVHRATRMLGASKPTTMHCPIVFDPHVTATLLAVVSSALSGEAVTKGRSFFADRMGELVASRLVTIVDDPTDTRHLSASQTDGEGLACRRNVLVDQGVLTSFVFDTVSARRAGTSSTGSAVRGGYGGTPTAGCRALHFEPGELDADAILALVGDGVYVQSVTGVHSGVNPISGDFSVGAEGLRIAGGVLGEPLREMTVASTLQRLLLDVTAIGSDVDWLPGVAAGQTLAVSDAAVSGS
ncbi:MAG TPA: TldD/PmbA family protein [Acidimicrobiales bacterium]|jgi:PmbA protein